MFNFLKKIINSLKEEINPSDIDEILRRKLLQENSFSKKEMDLYFYVKENGMDNLVYKACFTNKTKIRRIEDTRDKRAEIHWTDVKVHVYSLEGIFFLTTELENTSFDIVFPEKEIAKVEKDYIEEKIKYKIIDACKEILEKKIKKINNQRNILEDNLKMKEQKMVFVFKDTLKIPPSIDTTKYK